MKKSMFKRGIASATGILLAASQVGMLAMNTTAADVTVDAAYLTDVPVFVNPDGVLEYTDGSWYDLLSAAYTAADAMNQEIALDAAKDSAKGLFEKFLGAEATAVLLDSISNAQLIGNAGKYTITATLDECGEVVGAAVLNKLCGLNEETVPMTLAGTLTVGIDMTTENTIAVAVAFAAEDGKTYTAENIDTYITAKLIEGLTIAGRLDKLPALSEKFTEAKSALSDINFNAAGFEDAYAQYIAALPEKIADKAPATLAEAMANEKANSALAQVIDTINGAQDIAAIDLTVADIAGIMAQGYDISIIVKEGTSALAEFSIADDQNAELLAAFAEYYTTADLVAELEPYFVEDYEISDSYEYTVTAVESHKEITAVVSPAGIAYEIVRVIDSVTLDAELVVSPEVDYTYSFSVVEDLTDGLYYWSEEEVAFDISSVTGMLAVYADGQAVDSINIANQCFAADAASAAELDYTGYGTYTVNVSLTDEAVADIINQLTDKGCYDAEALAEVFSTTDIAASFDVIVVDRGDCSKDGQIDTNDATLMLQLYNRVSVQKLTVAETQDAFGLGDVDFKALCFAADVNANEAVSSSDDAFYILLHFNRNVVQKVPTTWEEVIGKECVHTAAQHADPLVIFNVQN